MTVASVSGILSELQDIVSDQLQARHGAGRALGSSQSPPGRCCQPGAITHAAIRLVDRSKAPPPLPPTCRRRSLPACWRLCLPPAPQVVTYKWLGRRFNVPYDTAKRILFQFLTKHGQV